MDASAQQRMHLPSKAQTQAPPLPRFLAGAGERAAAQPRLQIHLCLRAAGEAPVGCTTVVGGMGCWSGFEVLLALRPAC